MVKTYVSLVSATGEFIIWEREEKFSFSDRGDVLTCRVDVDDGGVVARRRGGCRGSLKSGLRDRDGAVHGREEPPADTSWLPTVRRPPPPTIHHPASAANRPPSDVPVHLQPPSTNDLRPPPADSALRLAPVHKNGDRRSSDTAAGTVVVTKVMGVAICNAN